MILKILSQSSIIFNPYPARQIMAINVCGSVLCPEKKQENHYPLQHKALNNRTPD